MHARSFPPGLTALLLILALALALANGAAAQIYKVTDEKNGVEFTDRPQSATSGKTVEKVELPTLNTAPATEVPPPQPSDEPAPQVAGPSVVITQPGDESTVAMGPGDFSVSAATRPELGNGEYLLLLMDGEPYGEPQRSGNWFVQGAMRGAHDLRVQRQSAAGATVAQSEPVRVYVLRPSVLNR